MSSKPDNPDHIEKYVPSKKFKGNRAYILMGGRYVLCEGENLSKAEYLTAVQVEQINNLLMWQKYLDREISLIKQGKSNINHEEEEEEESDEPRDEVIADSLLSGRAKNIFVKLNFKNLSDIAKHPFSKWSNWRNMGEGTVSETKHYLIKNGFILNEK